MNKAAYATTASRTIPDPCLSSDLARATMALLADEGPVAKAMISFGRQWRRPTKEQLAYAAHVAAGLERGNTSPGAITLVEGDTGLGKSLAYMCPLALAVARSGSKGLVSTFTLQLQRQLLAPDGDVAVAIAAASQATNREITVSARRGMRNFISDGKVKRILASFNLKDFEPGIQRQWRTLQEFAENAWQADADPEEGEIDSFIAQFGPLPGGLTHADLSLDPDEARVMPAYRNHLSAARQADIVITSHSMLMLHAAQWMQILDDGLEDEERLRYAIVDEADRLETAAASMFDTRLPLSRLIRMNDQIRKEAGPMARLLPPAVEAATELMDKLVGHRGFITRDQGGFLPVDQRLSVSERTELRSIGEALRVGLRRQLGLVRKAGDEFREYRDGYSDMLLAAEQFLAALDHEHRESAAYLNWSPVRQYRSLATAPLYPAKMTARLWRSFKGRHYLDAIVLTSATLDSPGSSVPRETSESNGGAFSQIRRELDIAKFDNLQVDLCNKFAPAKFGTMSFVLADRTVPSPSSNAGSLDLDDDEPADPGSQAWLDYCAQAIIAAHADGGRVLVLPTSFATLAALVERTEKVLGSHLLDHRPGMKLNQLFASFNTDHDAVLVSPAAWEGFDSRVRHLIIPRLPFPPRNGPRQEMLRHLLRETMDEKAISNYLFAVGANQMRRKLRQGIGRGIRRPNDSVKLWLLDPRFPLPATLSDPLDASTGITINPFFNSLVNCIPLRFRNGLKPAFNEAKIFKSPQRK